MLARAVFYVLTLLLVAGGHPALGGKIGPEFFVTAGGSQPAPALASGSGGFAVLYQTDKIYLQQYKSSGFKNGGPVEYVQPPAGGGSLALGAGVVVQGGGNIYIVQPPADIGLGYEQINSLASGCNYPKATTRPNSYAIFVWTCGAAGVFARLRGEVWLNEFKVNKDNAANLLYQYPAVAPLPDGFVIVWAALRTGTPGNDIYARRLDETGKPVGSEFRVNSHVSGHQYGLSVAALKKGRFVVVWHSVNGGQDGRTAGIFAQIFGASGQRIGGEFKVNTYSKKNQLDPSVAGLDNGDFVVVWSSEQQKPDPFGTGVFGQLFDKGGRKLGPEFLVNCTKSGYQKMPQVAALPNKRFVVIWISEGPLSGLIGQRFAPNSNQKCGA